MVVAQLDIAAPPPVSAATLPIVLGAVAPGRSGEAAVAAAVGTDPGLAARVLAAANGEPFGVARSVLGLHHAVAELGPPVVRAIALGAREDALDPGDVADHHRHARLVATTARALAPTLGVDPEEAFVAGLLHDLGELLLAGACPDRYRALQGGCATHHDQLRAEAEAFDTDHALAGAEHLLEWRIPDVVVDAVADHHDPFPTSAPTTIVVAAADELVSDEPGRTRALDLLGLDQAGVAGLRRLVEDEATRDRLLVQLA